MQGIIHKVKDRYFFILIPDSRQIFGHISSWLSFPGPRVNDIVQFELVQSLKPQFHDQAANVKRTGHIEPPISTPTPTLMQDAIAALAEKADTPEVK